jgi:hypothetical protein
MKTLTPKEQFYIKRRVQKIRAIAFLVSMVFGISIILWGTASFIEVNYKNNILFDRGEISEYNMFKVMSDISGV